MEAREPRARTPSHSLLVMQCVSQVYALSLVLLVPVYCVYVVLTRPDSDPSGSTLFSLSFALFSVSNMLTNWLLFRRKLSVRFSAEVGASELSFCHICRVDLWRRDHHCYFLGGCVALVNQLNFIAFCLHSCLGCSYAFAVLIADLNISYKPLWSADFIYYFLPFAIVKWSLGHVTFFQVSIVCLMSSVLAVALSTGALFVFQLVIIYKWRTYRGILRGERSAGSLATLANFERAFGRRWFLELVFPKISLNEVLRRGDTHKII